MTNEEMSNVVFDVETLLQEAAKCKKERLMRKAAHVSAFALGVIRRNLEALVMDEVAVEVHHGKKL
jgi:hypothetical protein